MPPDVEKQPVTGSEADEKAVALLQRQTTDSQDSVATPPSSAPAEARIPFSSFTSAQKQWISWMAAIGASFSTLNSYIYFPAVVPIARDLGVSVSLVNLTITCYLIVAGIAPAFMGDMADHDGRRPVYVLMAVLMVGANIGLALQNSYAALFVLRMVQSAGSSGTFGAAHGVISDIAPVAERGTYTGTVVLTSVFFLTFIWTNR
jgi:MFS family permease